MDINFNGNIMLLFYLQSEQCCDCLFAFLRPIYTGGLFHIFLLDEFICHFRGVGSILSLQFYAIFDGKFCQQIL